MGSKRQRWVQTLQNAWLARGWLAWLLLPLAWLYRLAWGVRSALWHLGLWRSKRLPVPVCVVGNVVVGGAGKTPTVIALVQHLQQRGWKPGVVARGHAGALAQRPSKRVATGPAAAAASAVSAVTASSAAAEVGDEPLLIALRTGVPLFVGRDRVAAARALLAAHPQVNLIVSDDGMQHWALARDLTVLVFDRRGCGNGWLLPAGPLRQPWPGRVWGEGDVLVLHTGLERGAAPASELAAGYPAFTASRALGEHAYDAHGRSFPCADWVHAALAQPADGASMDVGSGANTAGQRKAEPDTDCTSGPQTAGKRPTTACSSPSLGALAGIAQPEAFFAMLRQRGLALQHTLALPDHADSDTLLAALAQGAPNTTWLCTEKDAVKLFPLLRTLAPEACPQVWALPLQQHPQTEFYTTIDRCLGPAP